MVNITKVMNGLECCSQMAGEMCRKCPYANECEEGDGLFAGSAHLAADALSLLKAREPKLVHDIAEATLGYKPKVKVGHCPSCGVLMSETDRFCRKCGQAVKWE